MIAVVFLNNWQVAFHFLNNGTKYNQYLCMRNILKDTLKLCSKIILKSPNIEKQ